MIRGPYTLFTRIPVYLSDDGRLFADQLWCKDLELHTEYIAPFALCCPVLPLTAAPEDAIEVRSLTSNQVVSLRQDGGLKSTLSNFFPNFRTVFAAVRLSRVVHSGGAGWAFPLSFYILPLSLIFRFQWVMVIESSFWMKPVARRPSIREWLTHHVHSVLLRACLRRADARIFTQEAYRRYFDIETERSLIAPAVWVDEDNIISNREQLLRLAELPDDDIRILFPARLVKDKGIDIVLDAIEYAEELLIDNPLAEGKRITLDIIGSGPLADVCRRFAESHRGIIKVGFRPPLPYGAPFLNLLREYHAVLLANRQQEQPRVIFDAFSQGVPVISSATSGVCDIVHEGQDALLFDVENAQDLAQQIQAFSTSADLRRSLAMNTLAAVRGRSHASMHRLREDFLASTLQTADQAT
ncbi:Glycosyltransferase involved in cell wall bisynthesis [Roseovarius litoreus]|uniref:Glycosyltransferase involved in cell wall bisynthesis n=1 Tax=Roseovarius litoreus TaxID=1155722 RepID=A0A1M7KAX8_9RHOB|nr:glycosyltransferase family 4 protein [Roseovarius litoreus]SHM62365.1 Glycosyltransferase involved in cell wall bisynthesis [Roseovarius litoreus]